MMGSRLYLVSSLIQLSLISTWHVQYAWYVLTTEMNFILIPHSSLWRCDARVSLQETLFDPVSLACGHMFCYMCACKAASVTVVDGLKAASRDQKCAICREVASLLPYLSSTYAIPVLICQLFAEIFLKLSRLTYFRMEYMKLRCVWKSCIFYWAEGSQPLSYCLAQSRCLMPNLLIATWTVAQNIGQNGVKQKKGRELSRQRSIGSRSAAYSRASELKAVEEFSFHILFWLFLRSCLKMHIYKTM